MEQNIEYVEKLLKINIPNKELYEKVMNSISDYYEMKKLKISINNNNIVINGKKKKDFLNIEIIPGTIILKKTEYDGKFKEHLIIKYEGYKTTIYEKKLNQYIYGGTKEISSTSTKIKKRIYNNGELIFISEINDEISSNINNENVFTYTEINRIDKNTAIKFNNSLEESGMYISYEICDKYDEPLYDDSKNDHNYYYTGFNKITSEEYYNLLNGKQKTITK